MIHSSVSYSGEGIINMCLAANTDDWAACSPEVQSHGDLWLVTLVRQDEAAREVALANLTCPEAGLSLFLQGTPFGMLMRKGNRS